MPQRIPKDLITLYRDGKQVVPEVGKPFDFTLAELTEINRINPAALQKPSNDEVIAAPMDVAQPAVAVRPAVADESFGKKAR